MSAASCPRSGQSTGASLHHACRPPIPDGAGERPDARIPQRWSQDHRRGLVGSTSASENSPPDTHADVGEP